MKFKKVRSILLVLALSCSMIVTPVLAAPTVEEATAAADQAAANQANLESQCTGRSQCFTESAELFDDEDE